MSLIDTLNTQFAIGGHLYFEKGEGNLPKAIVGNSYATAEIYLHGAHVTHFQPYGEEPLLWTSPTAVYRRGKAIRGGIPIIWPWFGAHPTDPEKPSHGLARTRAWTVTGTAVTPDNASQITLALTDDKDTHQLFPYPFRVEATITVGEQLTVRLQTTNVGSEPITIGGALHTYFTIGDIHTAAVHGFDQHPYLDQLDAMARKTQSGPIGFEGEVDRIYLDSPDSCHIDDPTLERQITLTAHGSRSTVVWNPWIEKAATLGDFPDDGYTGMLCVETANAADDVRQLPPGGSHALQVTLGVTPRS